MNVSIQTRQAYSEIDEFLRLLSEEQRNKIPQKLREFFKEEKDQEYFKNIDRDIPIKDQNLKEETLGIIALLNLQYWCKDEEEKKRLQSIYAQNEKEYQDMLYEKYDPNDIFKKKEENEVENNVKQEKNVQMVQYKEPTLKRILNGILRFLHIR